VAREFRSVSTVVILACCVMLCCCGLLYLTFALLSVCVVDLVYCCAVGGHRAAVSYRRPQPCEVLAW